VTVAIMPALIVRILAARWDDLIEEPLQIVYNAAFVLDSCERGGGGGTKDRDCPIVESTLDDIFCNLIGNVTNIGIALCAERNRECFYRHKNIISFQPVGSNSLPRLERVQSCTQNALDIMYLSILIFFEMKVMLFPQDAARLS
jgi:hypothetical protein